jgi:hypothetical protein
MKYDFACKHGKKITTFTSSEAAVNYSLSPGGLGGQVMVWKRTFSGKFDWVPLF